MPASQSSGEYPLLTSSTQSLASYTVSTQRCRVTDDLRQMIRTAAFTGWSDCNMIRMNGWLYWVLEANTSTDSQASVEFIVSYCGPSSVLHKGDSVVGCFSRLPVNKCPYLSRQAITSSLEHTDTKILPRIDSGSSDEGVFWVQATMTIGTDEPQYVQKGLFVRVSSSGSCANRCSWVNGDVTGSYPSLDEVMSDPAESFLAQASQILDISISARCPYEYLIDTVGSLRCYTLIADGSRITPTDQTGASGSPTFVYNIETLMRAGTMPDARIETISWYPSSSLITASGTITIRDEDTSSIAQIPCELVGDSGLTLQVQCISDKQALITYITYAGYTAAIQEGHLPYLGSQWDEYRAYSLSYDREAMENSIRFSNERATVQMAENAASSITTISTGAIGGSPTGMVSGAIGGAASFALTAWATQKEKSIAEDEARTTQALAERRVKGQPCTAYNSGYGLIYAIRCLKTPASIWTEMPAGLTESIDNDYTACFGYPAEGLRSISVQEGYIKGRIYDNGLARGPRFDRMNETLQNGILFKEV